MKYYKFPDGSGASVDCDCASARSLDEEWRQFRCDAIVKSDLHVGAFAKRPREASVARGDDLCEYNEDAAHLIRLGLHVTFEPTGCISLFSNRDVHPVIDPFLDLLFSRSGSTVVHSASLVGQHGTFLVAGWGGTGKTSAVCSLTKDFGLSFVSDDLSILSSDGGVFGYRRPMCLYPYHRMLYPDTFAASKKIVVPPALSNLIAAARQTVRPLFRGHAAIERLAKQWTPEYIRAYPEVAMPWATIVDGEKISSVVVLERWTIDAAETQERSADWAVNRLTGNYLVEIGDQGREVIAELSSAGLFPVSEWMASRRRILDAALANARILNIRLPRTTTPRELGHQLAQILLDRSIF